MSTTKRWISLLLVLCLLLSVVPVTAHAINASGTCGENLTWTLSNDGVLTISGSGAMESYSSSIDTPWSKISDSIRTIQISDGTISIGDYAFAGLLYLTDVSISKSVEFIGKRAFCDCPKLQGIFVDPNNEFYCNDAAGVLFDKAQNILVSVPGALVGSYIIPEGVIIIEEAAFQFSDISEVLIPNSVEYIGAYAFWDCDNLRRLDFPDSIESIGEYAVANCSNLFAITMGDSIITIENAAFFNCTSLESVTIPDSVISIGDYAFNLCSNLNSLTIGEGVVSIGNTAFMDCDNLLNVVIPRSVAVIGDKAFANCNKLEEVNILSAEVEIGDYAFNVCYALKSITIPDGVTSIGYCAFGGDKSLKTIYFLGDAPVFGAYVFSLVTATAYYPADNLTWTNDVMKNYDGNITWVPYTAPSSTPNNGTYTSPQESVWYDIWCVGVSRFNAENNFDLNVGGQTYPTGDSWKARADIPVELSKQVSISKDGWITCQIPQELVYTCREVVLYPNTQKAPFAQFVAARNNGDSMYVNLSCSHLSVYENAMRTYDMYVDINWNGYTPGKIYLKQGDKALGLREGKNQGLLLGMFTASGGDLLLCWETAEGTVYSQKMYLDIYKNSTSNMKLDSGESISGTNPASEVEDEMWGNLSFSMDLFNDSVPVELELSPTGLNKGTFKGTIGVKFENADDKKTVIDLLDTNLNKNWDYWTFDSLKKTLNAKYPDTLIPQQATSFVISADTQLIGVVEGTYELGADGSLVDMQLTDSKILSSVDGKFSVTRQHIVTPVPWYWTLELKAGFELALELQNEYDGTAASIAPLNSEVKVGIGAKAAVGVSGAASIGVKGGGNVYVTGQVLPIDFSKTEIYSTYDISLYGEFGPFKGDVFPYKSDKYYIWKNGKWVFSTNPSTGGGGGFRDSIPDSGFEMQQISRDYLNKATPSYDVHSVQLNSIADVSTENLVKANTYTFTEPQIVQLGNGNLLLVWVDDPGVAVRPVDINRAALFYSVYDGTTWSEPAMVSDDGNADASPVLKNIDGNVYLLWTNANAVFGEATDYEEYCASLDIAYARFDTTNAAFTDVTVIDTNESCDILPDMALVNGVPTVVWIQNDANDPFQASGGNKLYAASHKAGNWSVTVLADDLMVVDGLAVTGNGDVLNVYISQDTDGDTSTVEDRELFRVSENTVSQVTDNDTADLKPTLIDDSLYWYQNGVLTDGTQIVQLAEDTDRYVTTGNGTDSAVLYQRFNEDDSVTICANILHDSVWSDAVELVTIDRYLQKFDAVMADDSSITIITNEVELNDNVYQQADLCSYVFGQKCDIAVQQIYLNPLSMAPGGEMELFVTLKNMGTAGTSNVYARIYDGVNLLKEDLLSDMLDAGTEATVILTYPIEEGFGSESLRVEFWSESVTDGNEENNTADCEISYADVSVEELTAIQSDGTTHVSAYISNRGLAELSDVDVILYTKTGDQKSIVGSHTIPSLAVAMGEVVTFDVALEIDTVIYVEAVVTDEEFNPGNNNGFTIVTATSSVLNTSIQEHLFSKYISDGNATCTDDGTKTAKCDHCDVTDTIPDEGSALGHDLNVREIIQVPTDNQPGIENWRCCRCGYTEEHEIEVISNDRTDHFNDEEWAVLKLVNKERHKVGMHPLTGFTLLQQVAHIRSLELAELPEHTRPDGSDCFTAYDEVGLDRWSAGENIAGGQYSPNEVMDDWMNSSGHRGNILDKDFVSVGVGYYFDPDSEYGQNWVQNFRGYSDSFTSYQVVMPNGNKFSAETEFDDMDIYLLLENPDDGFVHYLPLTQELVSITAANDTMTVTFDLLGLSGSFTVELESIANPFADVAPGSFYFEPVMWAIENGITNGTSATTFGPNDQCMRAHVVTFLWRAVGSPEPTRTDNPFVDVKPTDFYYKPVLWAVENGITSGMDATHFGPTAYCNRAQVVTFLYRTMGNPTVGAATNPFTDVAAGSFYEKPVLWAVENGITNGLSATSFGPNSICNRAQIVTFLYRAFVD